MAKEFTPNPKPAPRLPAKRRPVNPVSAKQAAKNEERREFVTEKLTVHPQCQFEFAGLRCQERGVHVHELILRSAGGAVVPSEGLDIGSCETVCFFHHRWIHEHPAIAQLMGYLESTGGTAA